MDLDSSLLAVCGRHCGNCVWYLGGRGSSCSGCNVHKGHPNWGECRVHTCVEEHDAKYCGVCDGFPCDLIINYYDPGNPEGARNAAIRVAVNAYRARHGDEKTLDYIERAGTLNKPVK
ncbi:MAG: DUF3795 domain-containing protein [Candidatus Bathyarchaeota archaeon]|nr:MAG: DUF3795 domain-containing protein [Candidatus Bathyarchaeota archaeon]